MCVLKKINKILQMFLQYLLRIIKLGFTELSVIFPFLPADIILLLHLTEGGKPVWTLGYTHLKKSVSGSKIT